MNGRDEWLQGRTTFLVITKNHEPMQFHERSFTDLGKKLDERGWFDNIIGILVLKTRGKDYRGED